MLNKKNFRKKKKKYIYIYNLIVLNETNMNNCPSLMSVVFIFIFWGSI